MVLQLKKAPPPVFARPTIILTSSKITQKEQPRSLCPFSKMKNRSQEFYLGERSNDMK